MIRFSEIGKRIKPSALEELMKVQAEISFAAGAPSIEMMPNAELAQIAYDILMQPDKKALRYGITEGYAPLIEQLKERLTKQGIFHEGDELVITTGAQQGIDLIAKVFLDAGDTLICENPSYVGALDTFRSYGAKLVGVPMEADGMRVADIPVAKLIYTIPNFQNPTGITMSLAKRQELLKIAEANDAFILEDDPYGELRFEGENIKNIKELDNSGRVIYVGSFSKILSPGLRVGYVVANKEIINKILICKQTADAHTCMLSQMQISEYMRQYDIDKLIEKERAFYKAKRDIMVEAIEKHLPKNIRTYIPQGGIFLWCEGASAIRAIENGVAALEGKASMANNEDIDAFRLNYSLPSPEQIEKGIKLLARALTFI